MGKRKLGALEKVDADLPNLQHKIRTDSDAYLEDFRKQYQQYENLRVIFLEDPSNDTNGTLRELIDFVAHVSECYPIVTEKFPDNLIEDLTRHHQVLDSELREKLVSSLVLLRKKKVLSSERLLQTLFPVLVSTTSKSLRVFLLKKILSDLRSSNAKAINHKLNRTVQIFLFELLSSERTSTKGLWAVKLTRELWRRQIWRDAKTVEIMKEAALVDNEKVAVGGARFFLGGDKEREELENESSDNEDGIDVGKLRHQAGINKKTKKKSRRLEKAASDVKRKERKKHAPHPLNFSALHLLHDPQGFAETLFAKHLQSTRSKLNLAHKLIVLQLVSRLTGLHKLTILPYFSYFLKYLTPRQPSVTSFLASLAQSAHNLVPPETLDPLVQKIANEFVSEAAASEVASAGLNAIREICVRQPLAMNETLLQDLVMYKKSKDKGVMMAAKGLQGLYRDVGPEMLKKKDRGKAAAMGVRSGERRALRFGEEDVGTIEGLDLLERWKEEEKQRRRQDRGDTNDVGKDDTEEEEEDSPAWDIDEHDSDDSGGWINVSDDEEIEEEKKTRPAISHDKDSDIDHSEPHGKIGGVSSDKSFPDDQDSEDDQEESDFRSEENDEEEEEDLNGEAEPYDEESDIEDDGAQVEDDITAIERPPSKKIRYGLDSKLISGDDKENVTDSSNLKLQEPNHLATTRILTPADFAKLHELRTSAAISTLLPSKHTKHHQSTSNTTSIRNPDDPITADSISGLAALFSGRKTRAEKLAHLAEMKTPRGEHKSKAGRKAERKLQQGKSSTNREKERKKNFLMTLGKAKAKSKGGKKAGRSLVQRGKVLKVQGGKKGKSRR